MADSEGVTSEGELLFLSSSSSSHPLPGYRYVDPTTV